MSTATDPIPPDDPEDRAITIGTGGSCSFTPSKEARTERDVVPATVPAVSVTVGP